MCVHFFNIDPYGGGYTAAYLKWYAKYWHGIDISFKVEESYERGTPQDKGIFRSSLFAYNYKGVQQCVVWIADCNDLVNLKKMLVSYGYEENKTFFDFRSAVYGEDLYYEDVQVENEFLNQKRGKRDIQDLEWLEWKYGCNFISPVSTDKFIECETTKTAIRYSSSTVGEVCEMLSRIHATTSNEDAFLDFGCGKGSAIVAALEYGFYAVGGVEFEPHLYEVLKDNLTKLGCDNDQVELICEDAGKLTTELDKYNYLYIYDPFRVEIMEKVIRNIEESLKRKKRKVYILSRCYNENRNAIINSPYFRLCMQFEIDTANRVCEVFESIV